MPNPDLVTEVRRPVVTSDDVTEFDRLYHALRTRDPELKQSIALLVRPDDYASMNARALADLILDRCPIPLSGNAPLYQQLKLASLVRCAGLLKVTFRKLAVPKESRSSCARWSTPC